MKIINKLLIIYLIGLSRTDADDDDEPVNDSANLSQDPTVLSMICGENPDNRTDVLPSCDCLRRQLIEGDLFLISDPGGSEERKNIAHVKYHCHENDDKPKIIEGTPYLLTLKITDLTTSDNSIISATEAEDETYVLEYPADMTVDNALMISKVVVMRGSTVTYDTDTDEHNFGSICGPYNEVPSREFSIYSILDVALMGSKGCPVSKGTTNVDYTLPAINFIAVHKSVPQGYYFINVTLTTPDNKPALNIGLQLAVPDGFYIDPDVTPIDDDVDDEDELEF